MDLAHDHRRTFNFRSSAMNTKMLAVLLTATSFATLAACNKAEAPADTAADVADARADAAENVADERRDAADEIGSAATDITSANQDVEEARIAGDHKIAVEKCEALAGEAQKACKDSADVAMESAKANLQAQMSSGAASGTATTAPGTTAAPGTIAAPASTTSPTR